MEGGRKGQCACSPCSDSPFLHELDFCCNLSEGRPERSNVVECFGLLCKLKIWTCYPSLSSLTKRTRGFLAVERSSDRVCLKQLQFSVATANSSYLVKKTRKKNKVEAGILRNSDSCCVSLDLGFALFRKASAAFFYVVL